MPDTYTAGSYTKNFSWNKSYKKLHTAIRSGFSAGLVPTARESWRERSRLRDRDRELIPLNFFLYSKRGLNDDLVLVDRLVERASGIYDIDFARLALFAFHLAMSGTWTRAKWPDGRVAGWANEFIRAIAWDSGQWMSGAFAERTLESFIERRIDGEDVTKRKVLTNYLYMLTSAGVLVDGRLQATELRTPWPIEATQLFWDRQIFDGGLQRSSDAKEFEAAFFRHEIYKLLGCGLEQGRAFVLSAYRDYSPQRLSERLEQLDSIKGLLAA